MIHLCLLKIHVQINILANRPNRNNSGKICRKLMIKCNDVCTYTCIKVVSICRII